MSLSVPAEKALIGRAQVCLKTLNEGSEVHLRQNWLKDLIEALERQEPSRQLQLGILLLVYFGRYQELGEWGVWQSRLATAEEPKLQSLVHKHRLELEAAAEKAWRFELIAVPATDCLVDVTETHQVSFFSGIQRVVQQLCRNWANAQLPTRLMKIDFYMMMPLGLTSASLGVIGNPSSAFKRKLFSAVTVRIFARKALHYVLLPVKFVGQYWSGIERGLDSLRRLRSLALKRRNSRQTSGNIPVLFLYKSKIILPEVASEKRRIEFYLSVYQQMGFDLTMLGHDLIPIFYPEFCTITTYFADYLRILRIATRVSAISQDVMRQIQNYSHQVPRINPLPLRIQAQELAGDIFKSQTRSTTMLASSIPTILSVGTIEPRKNHISCLRAARVLWSQGHHFRIIFLVRLGWLHGQFTQELKEAQRQGLPVEWHSDASDSQLQELYDQAKFTLFVSYAEGYGLPIVESLSRGKPCLTSNVGSMAEIAAQGGCLCVNPYSIEEIAVGIRRLLTETDLLTRLEQEARNRPRRTWAEYADDVYKYARSSP